jgi:hypothetical protein
MDEMDGILGEMKDETQAEIKATWELMANWAERAFEAGVRAGKAGSKAELGAHGASQELDAEELEPEVHQFPVEEREGESEEFLLGEGWDRKHEMVGEQVAIKFNHRHYMGMCTRVLENSDTPGRVTIFHMVSCDLCAELVVPHINASSLPSTVLQGRPSVLGLHSTRVGRARGTRS